jgi:hypothetical protein
MDISCDIINKPKYTCTKNYNSDLFHLQPEKLSFVTMTRASNKNSK